MRLVVAFAAPVLISLPCGFSGDVAQPPPEAPRTGVQVTPVPPGGGDGSGDAPPDGAIRTEDCERIAPSEPVTGCMTSPIACGDTVIGHTSGGLQVFDTRYYEQNHCTPATTDHDGGDEQIYELSLPAGAWIADVRLDTPCANLDLAAIRVDGTGCPDPAGHVKQCEMWPKPGTAPEHVKLVSRDASRWWLVVEGQGDAEGAFSLIVDCHQGLN